MINVVSAVGGLLLVGICINVLGLGEINLSNLLPAFLIVALVAWFYEKYYKKKFVVIIFNTSKPRPSVRAICFRTSSTMYKAKN